MTKKALFSLLTTLFCTVVLAQQESQYTQYMYNTMLFNPGYTGSREVGSFFGMFRTQWVGIKGHLLMVALAIINRCKNFVM